MESASNQKTNNTQYFMTPFNGGTIIKSTDTSVIIRDHNGRTTGELRLWGKIMNATK